MKTTADYPVKIYGIEFEGRIVYVGSTTISLAQRLASHYTMALRHKKTNKFHSWLREKMPEIKIVELQKCIASTRYLIESELMRIHNTIENGYNSEHAEHSGRPKGCKNPRGSEHYLFGKKMPDHVTEASMKARLGKPISEEHKRRLREGHIAAGNSQKRVLRSDGVEFPSMKAAAIALGVTGEAVGVACKKGTKCRGFGFKKI